MKVTILIPGKLAKLLQEKKHTRTRNSILQIYNAFLFKSSKMKPNDEYFYVPHNYLSKIRSHPNKFKQMLYDHGILEYYSIKSYDKFDYPYTTGLSLSDSEIVRTRHYYKNLCMRYKFLIDTTQGIPYEIEVKENLYDNKEWYKITKSSLEYLGIESKIGRDSFSRRLHTRITYKINYKIFIDEIITLDSYKDFFKNQREKYYSIDAVTSQPRILYYYLEHNKYKYDNNFKEIMEDFNKDLYTYIKDELKLKNRDESKKQYLLLQNGTYFDSSDGIRKLFPVLTKTLSYLKKKDFKFINRTMSKIEANIFIDDLMNNIGKDLKIDFCLSIHDCLLVKEKNYKQVLEYCNTKYSKINFKEKKIN